jgi:F-type H+-transporting ATPase subunit b
MSVWTYSGQILNFIIFVVVLYALLYKPVRRMMQERQHEMEEKLRQAEELHNEAVRLRAETEARAESLPVERERILREAREEAEAYQRAQQELAEAQGRERLQRFRRVMEQERGEMLERITGELGATITEVTSAIMRDAGLDLNDRAVARIEGLLDDLPSEDRETARAAVRAQEQRVRVRAAHTLNDNQRERLRAAIAERLELPDVTLNEVVDPSLLAGIEVTLGPVNLDAQWRTVVEEAIKLEA